MRTSEIAIMKYAENGVPFLSHAVWKGQGFVIQSEGFGKENESRRKTEIFSLPPPSIIPKMS